MTYIKDEEFIRGNCPMTKEEIRILSIAKLELVEDYTVLDIGAGTGSVSIQIAKLCPKGRVIGIEKDEEALSILDQNSKKFNADNFTVIAGEALQVEEAIKEQFDGIFIGGSGGNIEDIIRRYSYKLKNNRKMVLNFITLDNLYKAIKIMEELNFELECSQISVSKTKGKSYMLFSNNPIFILSGRKV